MPVFDKKAASKTIAQQYLENIKGDSLSGSDVADYLPGSDYYAQQAQGFEQLNQSNQPVTFGSGQQPSLGRGDQQVAQDAGSYLQFDKPPSEPTPPPPEPAPVPGDGLGPTGQQGAPLPGKTPGMAEGGPPMADEFYPSEPVPQDDIPPDEPPADPWGSGDWGDMGSGQGSVPPDDNNLNPEDLSGADRSPHDEVPPPNDDRNTETQDAWLQAYLDSLGDWNFDPIQQQMEAERDAAIRQMYEGAASRGMSQSGTTSAMGGQLYQASSRDIAQKQIEFEQAKQQQMAQAAEMVFADKWNVLNQAQQKEMAQLMYELEMNKFFGEDWDGETGLMEWELLSKIMEENDMDPGEWLLSNGIGPGDKRYDNYFYSQHGYYPQDIDPETGKLRKGTVMWRDGRAEDSWNI